MILRPAEIVATPIGKLELLSVTQRNWSRVATAVDEKGRRHFLKQFRTATGVVDEVGFHAEPASIERVDELSLPGSVVPILASLEGRFAHVYPFVDMTTPDRLLRNDPQAFDATIERLSEVVGEFHSALCRAGGRTAEGGEHDDPPALCMKGLDVRNIGVTIRGGGVEFVFFDFGPAYVGSAPESAAKWTASILLLWWGRDLRRIMRGVDDHVALRLTEHVRADLRRESLVREVEKLYRLRLDEPRATSTMGRAVLRTAFYPTGGLYWRSIRSWIDEHGPEFGA